MTKYIGSIIRRTPVTPTQSVSSGSWSLAEQAKYGTQGLWKSTTPAFISHSYTASSSSVTSLTIPVPTRVENGDLLLAFTVDKDGRTHNTNASFTLVSTFTSANNSNGSVQYRVASSEPATYTFTLATAGGFAVILMLFKNLTYDSASSWGTGGSGTIATAPTLTTSNTKYLLNITGGRNTSGSVLNAPTGFTSIVNEIGSPSASTLPFAIVSIKEWTSGATGTSAISATGTLSGNGAIHIALK